MFVERTLTRILYDLYAFQRATLVSLQFKALRPTPSLCILEISEAEPCNLLMHHVEPKQTMKVRPLGTPQLRQFASTMCFVAFDVGHEHRETAMLLIYLTNAPLNACFYRLVAQSF